MAKCNRDCFNCIYDDCIVGINEISSEERKEIRERDERYFNVVYAKMVLKQKSKRARQRGRKVVA